MCRRRSFNTYVKEIHGHIGKFTMDTEDGYLFFKCSFQLAFHCKHGFIFNISTYTYCIYIYVIMFPCFFRVNLGWSLIIGCRLPLDLCRDGNGWDRSVDPHAIPSLDLFPASIFTASIFWSLEFMEKCKNRSVYSRCWIGALTDR